MFAKVTDDIKRHAVWNAHNTVFSSKRSVICAVTGQLADTSSRGLSTHGLVILRTMQLADWTTRGLADAAGSSTCCFNSMIRLCGHTASKTN